MNSPVSWIEKYEIKPNRWVYVPTEETKSLGRKIIKYVNSDWKTPEYFYHLKKGGHVKALKIHTNNNYFSSLDLSDFFGSMSRTRVTRSLKEHMEYDIARKIANASTVPHIEPDKHSHSLPYGFSQSPLLASLCLDKSTLGKKIKECNLNKEVTISIYMDDIVISSCDENHLDYWVKQLKAAAKRSHLILNEAKESHIAQKIEVFNIILSHNFLEITKIRFNEFYLAYNKSTSKPQRHGIASYVWTVNPSQAKLLDQ